MITSYFEASTQSAQQAASTKVASAFRGALVPHRVGSERAVSPRLRRGIAADASTERGRFAKMQPTQAKGSMVSVTAVLLMIGATVSTDSAVAATHLRYMTTVNNGSVCHAINGNEAQFLQRRATALRNLNADQDIWTVCAVDLTIPSYETDSDDNGQVDFGRVPSRIGYSVRVDLSTQQTDGVTGVCVLREVNGSGDVVLTLTENLSMNPLSPANVVFGGPDDPLELASALDPNAVTVACLLPRNSQINRVLQVSYEIQEGFGDPALPSLLALNEMSDTPSFGGNGGAPSRDLCPEGEVLVGVNGSWGPSYVDSLQGVCAKPTEIKEDGADEFVEYTGGAVLPTRGKPGPSAFTQTCPEGFAVSGFGGRSGTYLDALELQCSRLEVIRDAAGAVVSLVDPRPANPPGAQGGAGGLPFGPQDCDGGVATGLNLRSGAWIDNIGLVCAQPGLAIQ